MSEGHCVEFVIWMMIEMVEGLRYPVMVSLVLWYRWWIGKCFC